MTGEQLFVEAYQRVGYCRNLDHNIRTVGIFFHHFLYTADLSLRKAQPSDKAFLFFF